MEFHFGLRLTVKNFRNMQWKVERKAIKSCLSVERRIMARWLLGRCLRATRNASFLGAPLQTPTKTSSCSFIQVNRHGLHVKMDTSRKTPFHAVTRSKARHFTSVESFMKVLWWSARFSPRIAFATSPLEPAKSTSGSMKCLSFNKTNIWRICNVCDKNKCRILLISKP